MTAMKLPSEKIHVSLGMKRGVPSVFVLLNFQMQQQRINDVNDLNNRTDSAVFHQMVE